jgi:hypothetical protein
MICDRQAMSERPTIGETAQPYARTAAQAAGVGFEPTSDLDGHCRFSRSDLCGRERDGPVFKT